MYIFIQISLYLIDLKLKSDGRLTLGVILRNYFLLTKTVTCKVSAFEHNWKISPVKSRSVLKRVVFVLRWHDG